MAWELEMVAERKKEGRFPFCGELDERFTSAIMGGLFG